MFHSGYYYSDTDSAVLLRVKPDSPALDQLFPISNMLGALKVEASHIDHFFGLAAKLYR